MTLGPGLEEGWAALLGCVPGFGPGLGLLVGGGVPSTRQETTAMVTV
ncbi:MULTISPECIES: hypothetical protein [unclassified Crossiella]|nr:MULTISPECIES: hypothetical protein [unclassified Crossiella]MCK2239979.1 hypothetical protein [Crossiella sp. S99.2]MCK2252687.1 hypothetical protein [Crossiella sp. S99.1]